MSQLVILRERKPEEARETEHPGWQQRGPALGEREGLERPTEAALQCA